MRECFKHVRKANILSFVSRSRGNPRLPRTREPRVPVSELGAIDGIARIRDSREPEDLRVFLAFLKFVDEAGNPIPPKAKGEFKKKSSNA